MKRSPALFVSLAALALWGAGCDPGFQPQYLVTGLRILAVRAEVVGSTAADAMPGDSVQLSALVVDLEGTAGPPSVRWFGCAPAIDPVAPPPCLDEQVLKDPSRLADLAQQPGSGVVLLGEGPAPAPIPVVDVAGALDEAIQRALAQPTYQCSLYAEVPIVVVAQADGRSETAVKRVRITPRPETLPPELNPPGEGPAFRPNLNPEIFEIYRGATEEECRSSGTPIAAPPFPAGRAVLCARISAPGSYAVCGPDGPEASVLESQSLQWFVTAGEFPDAGGIGNAVDSAPDFDRPAGPFTLWLVLRDGRGGMSWASREIGAAP